MFKKGNQFFKKTPKRQRLSLVLLLVFLFLPAMVFSAGLVPCGGPGEPACQLCHFFVEFDNLVRFVLFKLVPPVAVLMFVIAGINFLVAADSPARAKKGMEIFRYTIFGLVLVFGAWLLVNVFFDFIGVADWAGLKGGGWSVIDCPLELAEQGSFFAFSPDKDFSINKGDKFSLNLGLNVDQPLAQAELGLSFDHNLLTLEEIIVHPANSNFKTFLPMTFTPAGELDFNKDQVKAEANSSGKVRIEASIFDFRSGDSSPQSQKVETLVTLIFIAREKGNSSVELDLAGSKLIPAAGPVTNIHKPREQKIAVTVS